jgi:hypothetical protein
MDLKKIAKFLIRKKLSCVPAVAASLWRLAITATCTLVLTNVIGMARATAARDVRQLSTFLTHTWCAFHNSPIVG